MKLTRTMKYLSLATASTALLVGANDAQAQTESVNINLVVQNALTLTETSSLNYGTVVAIGDAGGTKVATAVMSAAGVLTIPASGGGTAVMAIVDSALASAARITVEDGANTATINITITTTLAPTDATHTFDVTAYETSWNGGGATAQSSASAFTEIFDSAYSAGVNELEIGATIATQTAVTVPYGDAPYAGSFDVLFAY